ncbi:MAG: ribonuclease HII [Chitinophagales bacterium]|nr:ribonuclease HII [Chitinophagales bacterium]
MLAAYHRKNEIEAGCDEAGRGCYAGPVVAAAVILPKNFKHPLLNDSKKLSAAQREELRPIIEKKAIAFGIGVIDHEEIDPSLLLIDGNRFSAYPSIPHQCFVKGDGRFASIAAASILAKTYRDQLMQELHQEFPQYGWDQNKGYGTAAHRKAIETHGLCTYHRKSFRLLPQQGELDY